MRPFNAEITPDAFPCGMALTGILLAEAAPLSPPLGTPGDRGTKGNSTFHTGGQMKGSTDSVTAATLAAVERFNAAFNRHDVDAVMTEMTEDCIFENTSPFPDGARHEGQAAVRAYWEKFFQVSPTAHFESEEVFAAGDRCVVRWIYRKMKDGKPWHLRGVDIFRIKDGKVFQKLSYVKG
jgi:ketosteroid isomerase-like protein